MKPVLFAGLLGLLLHTPALPAKKPPTPPAPQQQRWEQEPRSFLGIEFDRALSDQVAECPKVPSYKMDAATCYSPRQPGAAALEHPPRIGIPIDVTVYSPKGTVSALMMTFPQYTYPKMLALLESKYGPTREFSTTDYVSRGGAAITGRVHVWAGENVVLMLLEYGTSLDESIVDIHTLRFAQERDEVKRSGANKFKDAL